MSLRIFPALLIAIILYNVLAVANGFAGNEAMQSFLAREHVTFHMFSGDAWDVSLGDLVLGVAFICLFIEVLKAARMTRELVHHGLAVLVFLIALVEFIVVKGFSTSVFFFVLVITAFDVVAGYTIAVAAGEHDPGIGRAVSD